MQPKMIDDLDQVSHDRRAACTFVLFLFHEYDVSGYYSCSEVCIMTSTVVEANQWMAL